MAVAVASLLLAPGSVAAQIADEPDPTTVSMRLGPLWVKPTIAVTNIGVDNNVFNQPDNLNPKSDFTFTATPVTVAPAVTLIAALVPTIWPVAPTTSTV